MRSALQEDLIPMGLRLDELTISAGSTLDGQPLSNLELGGNLGFLIVAVRRSDGSVLVDPPNDLRIAAGDALVVLGRTSSLPDLARISSQKREVSYRGVKV
jgi:voltage-gated potassium channel